MAFPIPKPDKPPASSKLKTGQMHVSKYETYQKPNGTWGLRPVKYASGPSKLGPPKVSYTPLPSAFTRKRGMA